MDLLIFVLQVLTATPVTVLLVFRLINLLILPPILRFDNYTSGCVPGFLVFIDLLILLCTSGFDNYTCGCAPGFSGSTCEEDIDECLSSPCPTNHTCVDDLNAYQCICQAGWPCNQTSESTEDSGRLDRWLIGVIAGGVVLFIIFIIAIVFIVYKCTDPVYSEERYGTFVIFQ